MAEKKKTKKRKEEQMISGENSLDRPSKDEYRIANWLRKNVPIKKTKFLNHNVEYFTGRRAVDALLTSAFAQGGGALFHTREEIVDYLHIMLEHKFYHRARKVPVSDLELLKNKKKKTDTEINESTIEPSEAKDKRKRKIRLDMHNDQRFVDGLDAYVWIYDPIPFYYWIIGTLLVLGAIGICLFPLWPPSVRLGVYYLSIAAAGFLVTIIVLAVLRLVIFCLIWILTLGKHHLWILPNLIEDVGFFASFWPLYTYEYKGVKLDDNKLKKKKKLKEKLSDDENEDEVEDGGQKKKNEDELKRQQSGSESESSQRSSTGKDFEIVDGDDLES